MRRRLSESRYKTLNAEAIRNYSKVMRKIHNITDDNDLIIYKEHITCLIDNFGCSCNVLLIAFLIIITDGTNKTVIREETLIDRY